MLNIIIALISAIATVAAAIIYFKTLKELKRQRENTYRPHLFIDTIQFYVGSVKKDDIFFPQHWTGDSKEYENVIDFDDEFNSYIFNLKCYNIGFGTAKNIEIKYDYDIESFIKCLTMLGEKIIPSLKIKIEHDNQFVSFSHSNPKLPYYPKSISKAFSQNYLSYLLPVSTSNSHASISMPSAYLELLCIANHYLINQPSKRTNEPFPDISFPKIIVTFTFKDISNRSEVNIFEISTEFNSYGIGGFSGRFKVTAI